MLSSHLWYAINKAVYNIILVKLHRYLIPLSDHLFLFSSVCRYTSETIKILLRLFRYSLRVNLKVSSSPWTKYRKPLLYQSYLRDRVGRIFAWESSEESVGVSCSDSGQVQKQGAFRGYCVLPLHTSLVGSPEHPKRPPCRRLRHAPSLLSTMGFQAGSGRAWESSLDSTIPRPTPTVRRYRSHGPVFVALKSLFTG